MNAWGLNGRHGTGMVYIHDMYQEQFTPYRFARRLSHSCVVKAIDGDEVTHCGSLLQRGVAVISTRGACVLLLD